MITLGVTGGIGSGKTTVCKRLEARGARVFYADLEAKKLMHDDPTIRAEVAAAFGPESYDNAGNLNRAYVASQVFGHPDRLAHLNAIVHPRLSQAFLKVQTQAEKDGVSLLVYEAAILVESQTKNHLDAILVVDAPTTQRIDRTVQRDQTTPEHVRHRMAHQLPSEELRRHADYLIENTGSLEQLYQQVDRLYGQLTMNNGQ